MQAMFEDKLDSCWRMAGYTFNRAWIYTVFFSTVLFEIVPEDVRWAVLNDVYATSIVCLAIGLAAFAWAHRIVLKVLEKEIGHYFGPLAVAVGMLLLVPALSSGEAPSMAILLASAVGTGFGSALLLVDIGRSFVGVGGKRSALETLFSTLLGAVLSFLLFFVPFEVAFFAALAFPFISAFCTSKALKMRSEQRVGPIGERLPGRLLGKFIVFALIVGSATSMLRDVYSEHGVNAFGIEYGAWFSACLVVAAVLFAVGVAFSKEFSVDLLYRPVVLLCIIGFALSPLWGPHGPLPYLVVTLGYSLFEVVIWVVMSRVATRFQYTSIQVFGYGRALSLASGILSGVVISRFASSYAPIGPDAVALAALSGIAVSLLAFGRMYVLTERDIATFETTMEAGGFDRPSEPLGDHAECDSKKDRKVPLLTRCRIIGEYYGLSKRETEVFHLLACGRNAARVQEELMISAGTVNTHTRHVYQKLGVHAQQELIDLMQQADLDAIEAEMEKRAE